MINNKQKEFVFRLWTRHAAGKNLSAKEHEIMNAWEQDALSAMNPAAVKSAKLETMQELDARFALSHGHSVGLRKYVWQAAAVIILFVSVGGWFTYDAYFKPDVYTAGAQKSNITLEDGTAVTLLPGASLTVEKSFPADTREVRLQGDAVFAVTKSAEHPFIVYADGFTTRVLGTVFKITQSGKVKSVDLYEGKVAVSSGTSSLSYLAPQQKWTDFGVANATAVIPIKFKKVHSTAIAPALIFNDVPFRSVAQVLEETYAIKLQYPENLSNKKITADLSGGTKEENIEAIAFTAGLQVHKEGSVYYFK